MYFLVMNGVQYWDGGYGTAMITNIKIRVRREKMFGTMHFIYYINRSIATKLDSTYLGS